MIGLLFVVVAVSVAAMSAAFAASIAQFITTDRSKQIAITIPLFWVFAAATTMYILH